MDKDQQFLQLLQDYRNHVDQAMELLKNNASRFNYYQEIREGMLDQSRKVSFNFHGMGCLVIFDGIEVDFDFSFTSGRYDKIDYYFLRSYWDTRKETYPFLKNEEDLEELFKILVEKQGIVKDPESKYGYYLMADWNNPKPKIHEGWQ